MKVFKILKEQVSQTTYFENIIKWNAYKLKFAVYSQYRRISEWAKLDRVLPTIMQVTQGDAEKQEL